MHAPCDPRAGGALAAGVIIFRSEAVDELREGEGGHPFADAGRPREDQAGRQGSTERGVCQARLQVVVTGNGSERHDEIIAYG